MGSERGRLKNLPGRYNGPAKPILMTKSQNTLILRNVLGNVLIDLSFFRNNH